MTFVKRNDLNKFLKRIENISNTNLKNDIAIALAEKGKQIAEYEYSKSGYAPTITTENLGDGRACIKFKAKDIAYHEFGTGIYAKGSYPDDSKLPKQTLTFESPKGKLQTTQGWDYYYKNTLTKRTVGGKAGWFIGNGVFATGNIAGAEIYYTSKTLRKDVGKIARSVRKGS